MFASARRFSPRWARQQSQRTTRRTPLSSTGAHPVSSQRGQGIGGRIVARSLQRSDVDRSTSDALITSDALNGVGYFCVLTFSVSACAGGCARTRSVGVDFTSAVERRCSQSSMPRVISFFTYSLDSVTSCLL